MTSYIYAIKDEKSGFDKVFTSLNDAYANREFMIVVKDDQSLFNKYPHDFSLWRIGSFDSKTGEVEKDLYTVATALEVLGE